VVAVHGRHRGGRRDPGKTANAAEPAALRGERLGQAERLGARLSPGDGVAGPDVFGQVQEDRPIAWLFTIEA
jgi:hypothetical protein